MAYHREPGEGARARLVAKRGTAWVARSRLSAFSNLRSFGSSVRPSRDARHLGSRGAPRCSRPGHGLPCSRLRLVNALRPWTSTATPQLRNPTGTKCRTILFFRQGPIYLRDQPENQRDHLLFSHITSFHRSLSFVIDIDDWSLVFYAFFDWWFVWFDDENNTFWNVGPNERAI